MNRNLERTKLMTWRRRGDGEERSQRCDRLSPGLGDSGSIRSDSKKRFEKHHFSRCEGREKIKNWAHVISVHVYRCGYLILCILSYTCLCFETERT